MEESHMSKCVLCSQRKCGRMRVPRISGNRIFFIHGSLQPKSEIVGGREVEGRVKNVEGRWFDI